MFQGVLKLAKLVVVGCMFWETHGRMAMQPYFALPLQKLLIASKKQYIC